MQFLTSMSDALYRTIRLQAVPDIS